MRRPSALRRLLVALFGLALVLPSALPHPVVAAPGDLPAALALICSVDAGDGGRAPNAASRDDPCDRCAGACHAMTGTLAAPNLPRTVQPWPPAYGAAALSAAIVMAVNAAHAARAPPAA